MKNFIKPTEFDFKSIINLSTISGEIVVEEFLKSLEDNGYFIYKSLTKSNSYTSNIKSDKKDQGPPELNQF